VATITLQACDSSKSEQFNQAQEYKLNSQFHICASIIDRVRLWSQMLWVPI